MRPDAETNNAYLYCIGEAAQKFDIDLILPFAGTNHHHLVHGDRHGVSSEFLQRAYRHLACVQNTRLGRWENFWSSDAPSIVRLLDPIDVIRKLTYAATNPVKDGLVARAVDWPGVNGLLDLLEDRTIVVPRPRHFFREDGPMPESVTLRYVLPPELGDPTALRARIRNRVAYLEERYARAHRKRGRSVLGAAAVKALDPRAAPSSVAPRRRRSPRLAACILWRRLQAIKEEKAFQDAYQLARQAWLDGEPAVFPYGTYWLARFANVTVAPAPKN